MTSLMSGVVGPTFWWPYSECCRAYPLV